MRRILFPPRHVGTTSRMVNVFRSKRLPFSFSFRFVLKRNRVSKLQSAESGERLPVQRRICLPFDILTIARERKFENFLIIKRFLSLLTTIIVYNYKLFLNVFFFFCFSLRITICVFFGVGVSEARRY